MEPENQPLETPEISGGVWQLQLFSSPGRDSSGHRCRKAGGVSCARQCRGENASIPFVGNDSQNLTYTLGVAPLPVTVTTRIFTCLVGDLKLNLHFALECWEGAKPHVYTSFVEDVHGGDVKHQLEFTSDHQKFQIPNMEVLNLRRLFLGW